MGDAGTLRSQRGPESNPPFAIGYTGRNGQLRDSTINYHLKCAAFWFLHYAPGSAGLHKLLQRRVTGRYHLNLTPELLDVYGRHADVYPGQGVALEIGSGSNLIAPLILSQAGVPEIVTVDINRLATLDQVNNLISQLKRRDSFWQEVSSFEELKSRYRIDYRAPADVRDCTDLVGRVGLVMSTSVLEHIPADDIRTILDKTVSFMLPGARQSHVVDYHDHYGSSDPSIGLFNFYRYNEAAWRRYNPPNHYQNRLRHSDYVALFKDSGLQLDECRSRELDWSLPDLERVPLASPFEAYSRDDLLAANGFFTLTKPVSD